MRYILYFLLIYFSIRFIFNFLIPVIRTTRQFKSQMKQFQQNMQEQQRGYTNNPEPGATQSTSQKNTPSDKGDYIDFEEIKS